MWSSILFFINFCILLDVTFGRHEDDDAVAFRIGKGTAAAPAQFPYVGFLATRDKEAEFEEFFCAGSIIHASWVLTAGHCCTKENKTHIIVFIAGVERVEALARQDREVIKFYAHERIIHKIPMSKSEGIPYSNRYDIAVVRLKAPLQFDNKFVSFIQLNRNKNRTFVGKSATYMGWGVQDSSSKIKFESYLFHANGTVINLEECRDRMKNKIRISLEQNICTRDDRSKSSTCRGDSGGPLVVGKQQIAVTTDVFCSKRPSVFMNVAVFFSWIRDQLGFCDDELFDNYEKKPSNYIFTRAKFNPLKCDAKDDCSKATSTLMTDNVASKEEQDS